MSLKRQYRILALFLVVFTLFLSMALAQISGGFELLRWTACTGGVVSGGNYQLRAVIGQSDAATLTGGNYSLEGGFLTGIDDRNATSMWWQYEIEGWEGSKK